MSIKVKGIDKLTRKLAEMEKRGARRALRRATTAGTAVLRKAVRAATPVDEGLLRKAQDSKVSGRGLALAGIVGANVEKLKEQSQATAGLRPTNIDWLVENGHTTPEGKFVPASGYMRRAAATAMPAAEAVFAKRLAEEIEREASR